MSEYTSEKSADLNSVTRRTRDTIVDSLFSQSLGVLFAHILAIVVYSAWLLEITETSSLLGWFCVSLVLCVMRFGLSVFYHQYHQTHFTQRTWVSLWACITLSLSFAYAYGALVITPLDNPQYITIASILVLSVCAISMIAHSASLYAMFCMAVPLSVVTSGVFLLQSTQVDSAHTALMASISIAVFVGFMFGFIRKVNKAQLSAIELGFQNEHEREKRKMLEQQLYEISRRDSLTGLFNRRYFNEMLEVELGRAYRSHSSLSLVLLDVDYFTQYNEHYGHVAGDDCLSNIASLIEQQTNRKGDLVARYGGEEFAIILPGIDAKGARAYASRLREAVEDQRFEHRATKLTTLNSITISLGVTSIVPLMKIKPNQLIQQADKALVDAKRDGRNRVKTFAPFGIDQGMI
ncbi:GGDEF domain-containing protein [Ningiella sp. W23]|uniref:GGDEF domain-containing protein n=1 Tax=Ningiella sp. W23 TaxID=3023715 RepID=UPI00375671C9